jgi:hypothetical protein
MTEIKKNYFFLSNNKIKNNQKFIKWVSKNLRNKKNQDQNLRNKKIINLD